MQEIHNKVEKLSDIVIDLICNFGSSHETILSNIDIDKVIKNSLLQSLCHNLKNVAPFNREMGDSVIDFKGSFFGLAKPDLEDHLFPYFDSLVSLLCELSDEHNGSTDERALFGLSVTLVIETIMEDQNIRFVCNEQISIASTKKAQWDKLQ